MLRAYLRYQPGEPDERRVPVGSLLVVGRTADCGLVLDDPGASRHHLEITQEGNSFSWRDLKSKNGTLWNGTHKMGGKLSQGDRLQIGMTVLLFELEESELPDESSMVHQTILDTDARATFSPEQNKAADLLRAVYTVSNEIATNYEPCKLVDKILETTMKAVDAQRGAIFFGDCESGELLSCPACDHIHMIKDNQLTHAEKGEIQISRSVAHHVLKGGESVLYQDMKSDSEIISSESIQALQLRSIICVPLKGKFGILGVLYMDTTRPEQYYTREDMLLSTAVGNSAGLAIENAKMHRQILEKQRMDQEIEYAWAIQEGFLIREWPEDDDRFEVYGETRPAKTVGGDFYDFVRVDPQRIGVFIGDVSGKGVPAALAMAQILAEFRLYAREMSSPKEVLQALNENMVKRSKRGMFITLCLLILDLETGKVTWANAGHNPPILIGKKGASVFPEASGPPVGVIQDIPLMDEEKTLSKGEVVLLYTDGIVEARSKDTSADSGKPIEYSLERLSKVSGKFYGRPPRELISTVNEEVLAFCSPRSPHDDITMIAVRYGK